MVRAKIHRYASWATLPLFVANYYAGDQLYDGDFTEGQQSFHSSMVAASTVLFGVNSVTGAWNLWEGRKDPNHRTRRMVHGIMMLAADVGFLLQPARRRRISRMARSRTGRRTGASRSPRWESRPPATCSCCSRGNGHGTPCGSQQRADVVVVVLRRPPSRLGRRRGSSTSRASWWAAGRRCGRPRGVARAGRVGAVAREVVAALHDAHRVVRARRSCWSSPPEC